MGFDSVLTNNVWLSRMVAITLKCILQMLCLVKLLCFLLTFVFWIQQEIPLHVLVLSAN